MYHMFISTWILNLFCLYTNSQLVLYSGLQTLQLSTVRAGDASGYPCFGIVAAVLTVTRHPRVP